MMNAVSIHKSRVFPSNNDASKSENCCTYLCGSYP